jgi:hypothetical protein
LRASVDGRGISIQALRWCRLLRRLCRRDSNLGTRDAAQDSMGEHKQYLTAVGDIVPDEAFGRNARKLRFFCPISGDLRSINDCERCPKFRGWCLSSAAGQLAIICND